MEATHNPLGHLEAHLARTLKPVAAPHEFSQRLRGRIRLPEPRQIARRLSDWYFIFFVVGGVVSAAVLVVTVVRAVYFLTRRRVG